MTDIDPDFEAISLVDRVSLNQILECVFGIRQHEIETYLTLLEMPGSTVTELASVLERDRSTVSRTLASLQEHRIVERERRIVDGGGYVYQYHGIPVEQTRDRMREGVDQWARSAHAKIDAFGDND